MAKQVPAKNGGTLTRPDKGESMNPGGRPPGAISFKAIAEKLLDGKITIEQAGEMRQITRREKMILNIIDDAVNDEDPNIRLKAVAYIMEKTEGKVPDKMELTGADGAELGITIAKAEKIAALLDEINGGD
jgi:hypothetical protein